jgi:hypothetical protein
MILRTSAPLSEIANAASRSFDNSNYHFHLLREDGSAYLECSPGNPVASLDPSVSQVVNQILLDMPSVDFDFYVTRQSWSKTFRSGMNSILNARVNVSVNASLVMAVGKILSAKQLYLQRPASLTPGQIYQNPHHVKFPGIEPRELEEEHKSGAQPESGSTAEVAAQEELNKDDLENEFAVVFGSLIRSHCLSELAADRRIKTALKP